MRRAKSSIRRSVTAAFSTQVPSLRSQLNWGDVLSWWMKRPVAVDPAPEAFRIWPRFVADNLEFRLGVAVGASLSQLWSANAGELESPSLETWRATTGLALAQGIAGTREGAQALRPEFKAWVDASLIAKDPEALIDPQNFRAWQPGRHGAAQNADIAGSAGEGDAASRHRYDRSCQCLCA